MEMMGMIISRIERGERRVTNMELVLFAKALEVSIEWLGGQRGQSGVNRQMYSVICRKIITRFKNVLKIKVKSLKHSKI